MLPGRLYPSLWFSMLLVVVSFSVLFSPSMCQDDIYFGWEAEWPSNGKELFIRFIVYSLGIRYIFNFLVSSVSLWF